MNSSNDLLPDLFCVHLHQQAHNLLVSHSSKRSCHLSFALNYLMSTIDEQAMYFFLWQLYKLFKRVPDDFTYIKARHIFLISNYTISLSTSTTTFLIPTLNYPICTKPLYLRVQDHLFRYLCSTDLPPPSNVSEPPLSVAFPSSFLEW